MFSSATFISPYTPTDLGLVFVNSLGRRVRGINVCKYNELGIDSNIIWVLLEGNEKIILDFATTLDANSALTLLKTAFDTLTPNCALGSTPAPPAGTLTILTTTLAGYNILRAANQLTSFGPADVVQWYDVTDTGGVLGDGAGAVYRVLALSANDAIPHGFCLNNLKWGTVDFINTRFKNSYLNTYHEITSNNSTITNSNASTYLVATNNSRLITSGAKSNEVSVDDSSVTIDNCNYVHVRNSVTPLVLSNCTRCYLDGINGDYHLYTLSDVTIDRSDTIGKNGHEDMDAPKDPLIAYIALVNQKIFKPTGVYDVVIRNVFADANAEFNFIVPSNFTGSIRIQDYASSTFLLTITAAHAGLTITFKFDKTSGRFYLQVAYGSIGATQYYTCNPTAGQTTFPSVLAFTPTAPTKSRLFLNGQKQFYGVDYSISGTTLLWVDVAYSLETTDTLELYYE